METLLPSIVDGVLRLVTLIGGAFFGIPVTTPSKREFNQFSKKVVYGDNELRPGEFEASYEGQDAIVVHTKPSFLHAEQLAEMNGVLPIVYSHSASDNQDVISVCTERLLEFEFDGSRVAEYFAAFDEYARLSQRKWADFNKDILRIRKPENDIVFFYFGHYATTGMFQPEMNMQWFATILLMHAYKKEIEEWTDEMLKEANVTFPRRNFFLATCRLFELKRAKQTEEELQSLGDFYDQLIARAGKTKKTCPIFVYLTEKGISMN